MPNRYCRDEIIAIALQQAQLPNLEIHDMPNGVVQQGAFSIQWLQSILDYWYHIIPFSTTVRKSVSINCTANVDYIVMPSDFIIDVRNGLLVQTVPGDNTSFKRAQRVPLQKFINRQLMYQVSSDVKYPMFYCVSGDDNVQTTQYQTMLITPTPTINTVCNLWYYQLPSVLEANQRPKHPDDYACIQYVKFCAHEWAGILQPGTAQKFCTDVVARYKASGLLNEPEDDEIPMDEAVYKTGRNMTNYSWLGPH